MPPPLPPDGIPVPFLPSALDGSGPGGINAPPPAGPPAPKLQLDKPIGLSNKYKSVPLFPDRVKLQPDEASDILSGFVARSSFLKVCRDYDEARKREDPDAINDEENVENMEKFQQAIENGVLVEDGGVKLENGKIKRRKVR